jgi:hypothetical protein
MNKINHTLDIDIKALDGQFIGRNWIKSENNSYPGSITFN